jgi:quinol monooxygenase YgiN
MALFGDSERIGVVAQIRARSGHEGDVREALQSLVGPSRKENGCLRYDLFEDKHHEGSFFTFEEWASEEALQRHLDLNKTALENAKALLREDLQIHVLKQLA